jgi:predicted ribosomally synthesized peptide with SipW-like signal peptide
MKKILLSLATIGVVGAIAAGATSAYFNDTETSVGNVFTAGTVDISVDGQNAWQKTYTEQIGKLVPGETATLTVPVKNEGTKPIVLRKMITASNFQDGVSTDAEVAETADNDISKALIYGMDITDGGVTTTVINPAWNVRVNEVSTLWVTLGTVEPGETVTVKQTYKMAEETTNWAQGDTMDLGITFYAEQTMGTGPDTVNGVVLDNKAGTDWHSVVDGELGIFNHTGTSYTFRGFGLVSGRTYRLAYSVAPYSSYIELAGATGVATVDGKITLSGTNLPSSLSDVKIWLLSGTTTDGWGISPNQTTNLWEANLINLI